MVDIETGKQKYNHLKFLTIDEQIEIRNKIKSLNPKDVREEREKEILEYYFIKGYTARKIESLKIFKSKNHKHISSRRINQIVKEYFPDIMKKRDKDKDKADYKTSVYQKEYKETTKIKSTFKDNICCKCGLVGDIDLHHMIPISLGGFTDLQNLMPLCERCHNEYTLWLRDNKAKIIDNMVKFNADYINSKANFME